MQKTGVIVLIYPDGLTKNVDLSDKVEGAPNFRYWELYWSDTALRKGINNMPTPEEWVKLERIAREILQPIRTKFGAMRINSGYRSVELCLAMGSSKNSNHARAEAFDIEPYNNKIPLIEVINWINDHLEFRELIAEYFPNGWIHVASRPGSNDRIIKLKDSTHNFDRVSMDDLNELYPSEVS
jgi:hypothetical protein